MLTNWGTNTFTGCTNLQRICIYRKPTTLSSTALNAPNLEDLYVYPEYRGRGHGKALFMHLVRTAKERRCGRMEWVCLNWNTPSINFYRSMGAKSLDEWTTYRLTEEAMARLLD